MERLTFLIDNLNRAAAKYHLEHDTGIEVKFRKEVSKLYMVSPNSAEVTITVWIKYSYHTLTVQRILIKSTALLKNFVRSSVKNYHVHAGLVTRCYQELVNSMVLGTGDWNFLKIITGNAVVNPFSGSSDPYYGKTFNDIIRQGFIHKEDTKRKKVNR